MGTSLQNEQGGIYPGLGWATRLRHPRIQRQASDVNVECIGSDAQTTMYGGSDEMRCKESLELFATKTLENFYYGTIRLLEGWRYSTTFGRGSAIPSQ